MGPLLFLRGVFYEKVRFEPKITVNSCRLASLDARIARSRLDDCKQHGKSS